MSGSSTTLESSLFESNVPGRYGSWAEEQTEANVDSSRRSEDEEARPCCSDTEFDIECQHQEQQQQQQQQQYNDDDRPGPRTGPKGVLADHKAHQEAKRSLRAQEQAHRQAVLLRIARGSSSSSSSTNSPPLPPIYDEKDSDDDDGDDAFMRSYRAQRLYDLKKQQQPHLLPRPCFGEVEEVSGSGMVDVVESLRGSSPNTIVVVHIYENHLPACRLVNAFLPCLAAKYPLVRFLRLHQGCNLPRMDLKLDEEALPLLLVYEGGEVKWCVVRVDACLGSSFLCEDLEGLLEEKGVWG